MASRGQENMFQMLKSRFPHLDLAILNPELTFSENLQVPLPLFRPSSANSDSPHLPTSPNKSPT